MTNPSLLKSLGRGLFGPHRIAENTINHETVEPGVSDLRQFSETYFCNCSIMPTACLYLRNKDTCDTQTHTHTIVLRYSIHTVKCTDLNLLINDIVGGCCKLLFS